MIKQLKIYYVLVSLPFVFLLTGSALFFKAITLTITRNPHPQINYTIFSIILVGGVLILMNTKRLVREAATMVDFSKAIRAKEDLESLKERANGYTGAIACLLQMVASSGGRSISHQEQVAIEHELANARSGLVRRNALPQYLTGLLVGMGLLGTFIGLLATLNDITVLISSFADIDMQNASPLLVFRTMIARMKAPMQSMGIAFSASMFGLLGSIILGLMMVGIRRLQGDIFSLMSSEIARHIELALSHAGPAMESVSFQGGAALNGDVSKVLIRIEERLAENARMQQRTLSSVIDDFQKQRSDMQRTLTEQTEASNNFRSEMQSLGRQLGSLSNVMEKGNGEVFEQVSELTVHLSADAKETHKLLAMQIDEQKTLRDVFDSFNLEERLNETVVLQQRALSSEVGDLQQQRTDMFKALTEQTEANNRSRSELQQLGSQLGAISTILEKGNAERTEASNNSRSGLQQLGRQLESIASVMEKGSSEVFGQLAELSMHTAGEAKETQKLLGLQVDEQKGLKEALDSYKIEERLSESSRLQQRALSSEIEDFQQQRADMLRSLTEQTEASNNFRSELQQLGRQLDSMAIVMEKGNGEICSQISELMIHMAADAKEANNLLVRLVNKQMAKDESSVE